MAVDNFNERDLVGKNLKRLVQEIEDLASDGTKESYKKLEDFMIKLSTITSDANFVVTKPDGKKVMEIAGEEIDITENLKEIVELTNNEINKNPANVDEHKARESLRKTISSTVGVLLKEDEIMQELAKRGLTNEEFIKNSETEIKKSEDKVASLKPLEDARKERMDKFGKSVYLESKKEYAQKSTLDDLRLDKESVGIMEKLENKLSEIKSLQDAAKTMTSDSTDYENNKKAIETLLEDVKGLSEDLKALDLREGTPKTTKIDFSYLEKLDMTSDYASAISKINTTKTNMDKIIKDDYSAVRKVISANYAEFGFADKVAVNLLTHEQIDEVVEKAKLELKIVSDEIKYEENYQQELKDSIEKFKTISDRETELSSKIKEIKTKDPVLTQKLDADGKPVVDRDGNPVMEQVMVQKLDADGKPVVDKDGNPVMEPKYEEKIEYVPTDDARKEYLNDLGIDEADYRAQMEEDARYRAEDEEASLTAAEKREMMRDSYRSDGRRFHPIQFLRTQLFPDLAWERGYAGRYLAEATADEVEKAKEQADKELNDKIKEKFDKDLKERKRSAAVVKIVRDEYKKGIVSAVSQEKMADELYRGTSETEVKDGATRASVTEAIRQVSDAEMFIAVKAKRNGEITESEYKAIEDQYNASNDAKTKMDAKASQDRAYAKDLSSQNTSRRPETPTYEDAER